MNLFEVYKLWDIEPVKGLDTTLWDKDGNEYTDLYGGHAVISVGHCHPHYVEALTRQAATLGFYSNAVKNSLHGSDRTGSQRTRTGITVHARHTEILEFSFVDQGSSRNEPLNMCICQYSPDGLNRFTQRTCFPDP